MKRFLVTCLLLCGSHAANAAYVFLPLNAPGTQTLDVISVVATQASGPVTSGTVQYDDSVGTGLFDMSATLTTVLGLQAVTMSATLTTNTNGSLHIDGLLTFPTFPGGTSRFHGDIRVDYFLDTVVNTSAFEFTPIEYGGTGIAGLLVESGFYGGNFLDFSVRSSALSFVPNPFPTYVVPLPATAWLFASGVFVMAGVGRKVRAA